MAYEKAHLHALGDAVLQAIESVKDGVGVEDLGAATVLFTAFANAADELKGDTDAAVLHLLSYIADKYGDKRLG